MELMIVAILALATIVTGVAVTDPDRQTWHPGPCDREGKQWSSPQGDRPARRRRGQASR